MEESSIRNIQRYGCFARICRSLLRLFVLFWSVILLNLTINIFSNMVSSFIPKSWMTTLQKPIQWAIQNPFNVLLIGICLFLLTIIFYLGSHPWIAFSFKRPGKRYLDRLIRQTEIMTLKGIPAGLIAEGVRLDEIFIPLLFRPNRPLTDYPLTEDELKSYHDRLKSGVIIGEIERVLFSAEKNWQHVLKNSDRVSIVKLWEGLTREHPAVVIQGFPGIGKSTLMMRLTLYMARRCLGYSDPIEWRLKPKLIPVF